MDRSSADHERHGLRTAVVAVAVLVACALSLAGVRATAAYGDGTVTKAPFASTLLPSGVGFVHGIDCPSSVLCYAAGQATGSTQSGLVLRYSAGTWQKSLIPSVAYLTGVSCESADVCWATGVAYNGGTVTGVVVGTTNGTAWSEPSQPGGSGSGAGVPLNAVSCYDTFCMSVGSNSPNNSTKFTTDVWVTNGQGAWHSESVPTDHGPAYLYSVSCDAMNDCWAVGGGVWHTTDGGQSWTKHDPAQPNGAPAPGEIGLAQWSLLTSVQFTNSSDGVVAGGDQCGGDVTQCSGAIYETTDEGSTWKLVSSSSTPFVDALSCGPAGGGPCVAASDSFARYSNVDNGATLLDSSTGASWQNVQRVSGPSFTGVACPSVGACLVVGGVAAQNVGDVFLERAGVVGMNRSDVAPIAGSLDTPNQVFHSMRHNLINAAITVVAILFITFPSVIFNQTFSANYAEILLILDRYRRRFRRALRLKDREEADQTMHGVVTGVETPERSSRPWFYGVLVAGAVLGGLLNPNFGLNMTSLADVGATLVAFALATLIGWFISKTFRTHHHYPVHTYLRALPLGLAIAALCVLVSRLTNFEPGYLYGVVVSIAFVETLEERHNVHLTIISTLSTLAVALLAWFLWVPVNHLALEHSGSVILAVIDDMLATLFIGGLVGTVIGLLPLEFLPGGTLAKWRKDVWAVVLFIALFLLVEVELRPAAGPTHPGGAPIVTALVLFVIFGGGSFWMRHFFARRKATRDDSDPPIAASALNPRP